MKNWINFIDISCELQEIEKGEKMQKEGYDNMQLKNLDADPEIIAMENEIKKIKKKIDEVKKEKACHEIALMERGAALRIHGTETIEKKFSEFMNRAENGELGVGHLALVKSIPPYFARLLCINGMEFACVNSSKILGHHIYPSLFKDFNSGKVKDIYIKVKSIDHTEINLNDAKALFERIAMEMIQLGEILNPFCKIPGFEIPIGVCYLLSEKGDSDRVTYGARLNSGRYALVDKKFELNYFSIDPYGKIHVEGMPEDHADVEKFFKK